MPHPAPIRVPCLSDNFAWLLGNTDNQALVVDAGESAPILHALEQHGLHLSHIVITHYHFDHVGGIEDLRAKTGAKVYAPEASVPFSDRILSPDETVEICGFSINCLDAPGHARNHLAYVCAEAQALFCGDALFTLGCGRLFDGSAEQAWQTLQRFRALPATTWVCGGHDYVRSNLLFLKSLQGITEDRERAQALASFESALERGEEIPPSLLQTETLLNPFMLADDSAFLQACGIHAAPGAAAFAELRRRKDNF